MRHHLARSVQVATLGMVLLIGAACGGGSEPDSETSPDTGLSPEVVAACDEFNRVINEWSEHYGAELAAVGQAEAEEGDEARREEAVDTIRTLFEDSAEELRSQADGTSDEDLAAGLTQAADGLTEIAGQIETYEDVEAAPELMSTGDVAEGGERVNDICAG